MNRRHIIAAVLAIPAVLLTGCSDVQDGTTDQAPRATTAANSSPSVEPSHASDVDQFREHVEKNGTPQEQDAVEHVVRMRTTGSGNLQVTTITTDLEGDLLSPTAKTGKLIAGVFADWKKTDHGRALVSVNAADGGLLANGNY